MFFNRSCITFVNSVIFCLLFCSNSFADFDSNANKSLERRLHNIYVSHYNRPVADSDWFKFLEAIEVQKHTVQPGDTLWGISKVYFGDGNYWSKLWSVNKSITNPHLIFVGDVISFRTGSFMAPPAIDIEKTNGDIANPQADAGAPETVTPVMNIDLEPDRPATPIPDYFENTAVIQRSEEPPLAFIERPKLKYNAAFPLTRDILDQPAEEAGRVESLGEMRMISTEGSMILLRATTEITEGSVYSILKKEPFPTTAGYPVHVQATVSITRGLGNNLYEGKILKQYDTIQEGDIVSTYRTAMVDTGVASATPVEAPIRILQEVHTLWTAGDAVFFQTVEGGSVSVGDVLRINNKFIDRVEFYVSNGFMKVVSVHPPFGTAIVINSREHIRANSVSTPTYTGWGVW